MSYAKAQEYFLCIEPLMAEETLVNITATSYPHQKKSKAQEIEKTLRKRTRSNLETERKQMSTQDIYNDLIRTLGNG